MKLQERDQERERGNERSFRLNTFIFPPFFLFFFFSFLPDGVVLLIPVLYVSVHSFKCIPFYTPPYTGSIEHRSFLIISFVALLPTGIISSTRLPTSVGGRSSFQSQIPTRTKLTKLLSALRLIKIEVSLFFPRKNLGLKNPSFSLSFCAFFFFLFCTRCRLSRYYFKMKLALGRALVAKRLEVLGLLFLKTGYHTVVEQ